MLLHGPPPVHLLATFTGACSRTASFHAREIIINNAVGFDVTREGQSWPRCDSSTWYSTIPIILIFDEPGGNTEVILLDDDKAGRSKHELN